MKMLENVCEREEPPAPHIRYLVKNVKETGILIDKPNQREKPKLVRTIGAIGPSQLTIYTFSLH